MHQASSERDRLRSLVAGYCLEHGVSALTLRSVSQAIGTNNRMLLYYFESKEQLISEALAEASGRFPLIGGSFVELASSDGPLLDRVLAAWRSISAEVNLPFLRLFFEVFGLAVRDPDRFAHFLDSGLEWGRRAAAVLRAEGVPAHDARILARELVALWRGLQFDLLATGNRRAIDRSHEAAAREFVRRVRAAASDEHPSMNRSVHFSHS